MVSNLRRTGINVIGEVPWGTHFCQFYETSQDLIETLVPYFKEGLASNEFCMWVTSEPLQVDQATAALRSAVPDLDNYIDKGQIEILDYSQWYTRSGKFSAEEVLQGWVDKLKAAQERGYEGLRLTGNTFWLEKVDWDDFTKYEETVNSIIGQYPMLAICTYSLQKCNALELLDVVANHQFALIKRSGRWEIIESTRHKKIEQAMRESEEKLSALYASMVEGVALHEIIYDESENPVDYVITDVNPSYEKITGLSRDKALGRKASELYGLNEPPYLDIYARVASSGKPESFETYFAPMKKHFNISVFSPGKGKFATVFSDITERTLAEEALQESEENYRELVENANSIIIKMDRNGKVTFFNDYAQKFFGYSLKEIIGQNVNIIVPPIESNGRNLEEMVDNILKNPNGFVENINENVRKNGDRVWISWRNKAIKDACGNIIGNLAVGQDITERKQTEIALYESEQRYVTTLASIGDAVIATDIEGRITFMNAVAEDLTGWSLGEASQKPAKAVFNIINEYTRQKVDDPITKVLENGMIVGLANHTVLIRRNETEVAIDDSGAPIRDQNGEITGVVLVFRDISERRRMEEEHERLSSFPKLNPNPIVEVDQGCRVHFLNPAAQHLFPDLQESGCNHAWLADWESVVQIVSENEMRMLTREIPVGERWFQQAMYMVPGTGSIRTYGLDITEHRQMEESRSHLASIVESSDDAIIGKTLGGIITSWNSGAEKMYGYSAEEVIGRPISILALPDCPDEVPHLLERIRNGDCVVRHETVRLRKDGTHIYVALTISPIKDLSGRLIGASTIARDITKRKQAEDGLRAVSDILKIANNNADLIPLLKGTVDYLKDLSHCTAIGIRFLDEAGNIPYQAYDGFSQSFYELESPLSIKSDQCMCINVIKGDVDPKLPFYTDGGSFYMNGTTRFLATVSEDDKGRTRNVCNQVGYESVALIPIRFENNILGLIQLSDPKENMVPLEMVEVVEKIAMQLGTAIVRVNAQQALKDSETELRIAKDDLELKVQERTSELQSAKEDVEVANEELRIELEEHSKLEVELVKAKDAAEESVKAKSAFLANMSHELRTPMNAVLGFSSLLLDDTLTQEHKEYIEGIRKGGEALLTIINDILDFSRAEKDKIELEHQPFSLKHLIDESLDMVATQAGKKGLNLSQTINYGTPDTIIGDQGRLRQILVNLLTNAIKFTDNGDVSVSISSKAAEGDRHQIFFKVKDTGIGIPQDKMNEIFEPFVQVERTLSRKRDGVGLGLAITKQLVELMGGTIWAESIPGQGATFHFTIQAETILDKQLDFGRMDSGIASESFPGLKPMRILVAEDNPSNQRVLVEMLKRLGYRADAVADGREVIQALERQDYDLVLMDIKMPEMDGITATQVIRKLRPENGPKIVAITAFALEGDREKCLEAGMDDYIAKPVQMRELAEVLKRNQIP